MIPYPVIVSVSHRVSLAVAVSHFGDVEVERPVVLLDVCMNNTIYEEQFSLRDRGDMIYPLLLGRRTIRHLGLIDVSKSFLNEPECDHDSKVVEHKKDSDSDD